MRNKKIFKKKYSDKMICSTCGECNFKIIDLHNKIVLGKIIKEEFYLHCINDHVTHFKEYEKVEDNQPKAPKKP